jgi:hypothetical protein
LFSFIDKLPGVSTMSQSVRHPAVEQKPVTDEMRTRRHGVHNVEEFRRVLAETRNKPGAISFFAFEGAYRALNDPYLWTQSHLARNTRFIPDDEVDICLDVLIHAGPLLREFGREASRERFLLHLNNTPACEEILGFANTSDDPLIYWAKQGLRHSLQIERMLTLNVQNGTIPVESVVGGLSPDLDLFMAESERLLDVYFARKH